MKRKHKQKPLEQRRIASERIEILFKEARSAFKDNPKLSNRYVDLARKMSMRYKVKIPSELKRQFCKKCHVFLVPSKNCTVRLVKQKVVYYCKECKNYMRFPYVKEKKSNRK